MCVCVYLLNGVPFPLLRSESVALKLNTEPTQEPLVVDHTIAIHHLTTNDTNTHALTAALRRVMRPSVCGLVCGRGTLSSFCRKTHGRLSPSTSLHASLSVTTNRGEDTSRAISARGGVCVYRWAVHHLHRLAGILPSLFSSTDQNHHHKSCTRDARVLVSQRMCMRVCVSTCFFSHMSFLSFSITSPAILSAAFYHTHTHTHTHREREREGEGPCWMDPSSCATN